MTAFRKNILPIKEFSPEEVKAVALAYAHQVSMQNNTQTKYIKDTTWELYDLLLDFEAYRVGTSFSKNINVKKIPPKLDNRLIICGM